MEQRAFVVLVLAALSVQFAAAQLDLSFIDPFYYLYNLQHSNTFNNLHNNLNNNNNNNEFNNGIFDDFHQQPLRGCLSSNQLQGTCMASHECKYSRGVTTGKGNCTYLHNCCTYTKTCNETVRARVVYFQNPTNARTRQSPCTLRLQLLNEDICQIRVDIDQLSLEQPATTTTMDCLEYITVSPTPTEDIPRVCGRISNSHFYIHLNDYNNGYVDINVILQQLANLDSSASWDMRLTQLECPGWKGKKSSANHKKRNENQAADDFSELAPAGCTQYYTQRTGTVQDFSNAMTPTTPTIQAACFKRYPNTCGVRFTLPPIVVDMQTCMDYLLMLQLPGMPMCPTTAPFNVINVPYTGPYWLGFQNNDQPFIAGYSLLPCPFVP